MCIFFSHPTADFLGKSSLAHQCRGYRSLCPSSQSLSLLCSYDFPRVAVGPASVGGAGKSPVLVAASLATDAVVKVMFLGAVAGGEP